MKHANLDEVLQLIHRAAAMQATAADCLARAATVLRNELFLQNAGRAPAPLSSHAGILPLVDQETLAVHWEGRTCEMGATIPLRLFSRLARRPGCFVRFDDLLQDVWDGSIKSPSTVRSAIRRLKRQLEFAGMHALADAIRCEGGRYGLVLNGRQ